MNFDNDDLLDALAREYALGTLRGAARRRFEAVLGTTLPARHAVRHWEQRLVPMAFALSPVVPPPRVWAAITSRIGVLSKPPQRAAGWWPALAAALAMVAVALGALYALREPQIVEPAELAVIADEASPLWLVRVYAETNELHINTVGAPAVSDAHAHELWMLPDDGSTPVSLGLLPDRGDVVRRLGDAQRLVLKRTSTLAVSLEPAGGSPTGAPTGPVVYTAPLLRS